MFRNRGELCSIMSLPFCVTGIEWASICDLVYIIYDPPPMPPPALYVQVSRGTLSFYVTGIERDLNCYMV